MLHPHLPATIRALDSVPPSFLDPHTSLLVISQDAEHDLGDACMALDAITWMLDGLDNANAKLKNAGQCVQTVDVMPEDLAALLRIVREKIKPHTDNPMLETVCKVRPDLFARKGGAQ